MTEPTELLPCPFCGSQARRSSGGAWFGTGCNGSQHCPAYLRGLTHRSQAEADAAWNTRTPQPTQAQAGAPCRKNPFYHGPRNCSRGTVGCCEDHGTATQAQAVAVPLTEEQIEALPMWKRFVGLWPETRREIVRTIERHHGIKGGQHGTE